MIRACIVIASLGFRRPGDYLLWPQGGRKAGATHGLPGTEYLARYCGIALAPRRWVRGPNAFPKRVQAAGLRSSTPTPSQTRQSLDIGVCADI